MEFPNISNDDVLDVSEMTKTLQYHISSVLKDNELELAMSALMSATLNSIIEQCENINELLTYRNIFIGIFDSAIKSIKIPNK